MDKAPLYQPLDISSHEIRLLRILPVPIVPAEDGNRIDCLLETVSFDTSPKYFGLSYEWGKYGSEQPRPRVFVNLREIPVRANLALAIARLQELGEDTPFWIDALCINQEDNIERAQQVRIMAKIYENSSGVYSWLGLEEGHSDKAMEFVEEFHGAFPVLPPASREVALEMTKWSKEKLLDPSYKDRWDGLYQLCERSYWKRVWIIQEIVVTHKREIAHILCGTKHVELYPFYILVFIAGDVPLPNFHEVATPWYSYCRKIHFISLHIIAIIRHAHAWASKELTERDLGLKRLLQDHGETQCTDLRDKIYALLGISMPYEGLELEINYSIPVSQVFINAAQYIIRGSKSLDILFYRGEYSLELSNLPSWVPDWSERIGDPRMVNSRIEFDACGSTAADVSFSLDNSRLTASGSIILGTVTELNDGESWGPNLENVPRDARDEFELRWIWQGLCRWLNFARWSIQFLLPEEHENEDFFLLPDELARAVFDTVLYTFCHESYERLSFEKFQALCNALSWHVPEVDRKPDLTGGELFELVLALQENRKLCKIRLSRPLPVRPPYINESGRSSSASVFEASGEESENESICGSDCSECFSDQASRNRSENGSMQGSKSGVGSPPRHGSRASSGNSRSSDSRSGSEDNSNGERQAYWMTTLGMCYPKRVKVGDVAVIVRGCKHPLLIREKENRYEIISELYLHGVMYGEAVGIYPETGIEFI